ncbi:MAG: GGDEF domain-containing protein [Lachnospiraceae bacterium]|nr:GGDEF domain-containing protein [Lachnospiraceae bacterium]
MNSKSVAKRMVSMGVFLLALIVWFIGIAVRSHSVENRKIFNSKNEYIDCNSGWYDMNENTFELDEIKFTKDDIGEGHLFFYRIPEDAEIDDGCALCFFSRALDYKVYIKDANSNDEMDARQVYTYTEEAVGIAGDDIGVVNRTVPLRATDAGKEIVLMVTPLRATSFIIQAKIQDTSEYMRNSIMDRMPMFFTSFFIVIWGICIMLYTYFAVEMDADHRKAMCSFGIFSCVMGIILLIETQVFQILTGYSEIYTAIKNILTLMVIYPLSVQVDYLAKRPHIHFSKVVRFLVVAMMLMEALRNITMHEASMVVIVTAAVLIVLIIIITVVYMIADIFYRKKNPKEPATVIPYLGTIAIYVVAAIDVASYFSVDRHVTDWGRIIRGGFMIAIIVLSVVLIRKSVERDKEARLTEMYKQEARTDAMTRLLNKGAFMETEIELQTKLMQYQFRPEIEYSFMIISFDLNDFKMINDTNGHAVGDEYIIAAANILRNAVSKTGDVYRVGGDEFIAVIYAVDLEDNYERITTEIEQKTQEYNNNSVYKEKLQFAYGHIICKAGECTNVYDAEKRADNEMYEHKRKTKGEI